MAKKTESTALSINLSTITKDNIPEALSLIKAKLKEFKKHSGTEKEITAKVPGFNMALKDFTTVADLLKAYSSLQGKEEYYTQAAKELIPENTVKIPPYTPGGHSLSQWKKAFKARVAEVANKQKIDQLTKMEKTLSKHLSEEAQLQNDLNQIGKDLSGFSFE